MAKDYYQTLGVPRNADEKEIKSAYRKLARKYHPDVNPGDKSAETRFKEVSEAYDVVGDPEKRKLYDQFGEHWEHAGNMGGGVPGQDYEVHFGGGGFESIFSQFFGGGFGDAKHGRGRGSRVQFEDLDVGQPKDVEKIIELPLEEIDNGTKRTL